MMDISRAIYHIQNLTLTPLQAAIVLVVTIIIILFIFKILSRPHAKKYIRVFSETYEEKGNVLYSLQQAENAYKRGKVRTAIHSAILHLTRRSILRDYRTAFRIIENTLSGKKVRNLHEEVLEEETRKKSSMLLLSGHQTEGE